MKNAISQSAATPGRRDKPSSTEWLTVLVLLALGFLGNLFSASLFPSVWTDDILWSEPAINLVRTGHFTTSVWQLQPANTFWAAHCPLYPLLLSLWLRLTNFSLTGIRSFNLVLITLGALLSWTALWRFKLVTAPRIRVLAVPLVFLGYGISFAYRCARPDILGMLSLLCLWLAFSLRSTRLRNVLVISCAAATVLVGVQLALYAVCASLIARLFLPEFSFRDLARVWLGVGLGVASVLIFYAANGCLPYFMATLHQAATEQTYWGGAPTYISSLAGRLKMIVSAYVSDFSLIPLILAFLGLWFWPGRGIGQAARRPVLCLAAMFVAVPIVFNFAAHFAFYYSYLIYVPLLLAVLTLYSAGQAEIQAKPSSLLASVWFYGALGVAGLVGLPLRLALGASFYKTVPRSEYRQAIAACSRPDDFAFCDCTAFFEAKQNIQNVYSPMYAKHFIALSSASHEFSPVEKAQLTLLIIRPERLAECQAYFGGKWIAVSPPFGDSWLAEKLPKGAFLARRLLHHFETPQMARYPVQVFRREQAATHSE